MPKCGNEEEKTMLRGKRGVRTSETDRELRPAMGMTPRLDAGGHVSIGDGSYRSRAPRDDQDHAPGHEQDVDFTTPLDRLFFR